MTLNRDTVINTRIQMRSDTAIRQQINHDLLDQQKERTLLAAARRGEKSAINEVIACNQRLVYRIAIRYYRFGYGGDQELADLMQWGNIGLLKAIRKWDGREGKFSTYATYWIEAYVRRFSYKYGLCFGISFYKMDKLKEIRTSRARLTHEYKREPTAYEIANDADASLDDVIFSTDIARSMISLDAGGSNEATDDQKDPLYERIPDEKQNFEAELAVNLQALMDGMKHLSDNEKYVIEHRYGLNNADCQTYQQIGRNIGVSNKRARQLERLALIKLRFYVKP